MSLVRRLVDTALGTDPKARRLLQLWSISSASYLLYFCIVLASAAFGYVSPLACGLLIGLATAVQVLFFGLIRSGASRRLSKDPGLGTWQLVIGIGFFWLSYATSGAAAPATTIIIASHVVYAMFGMPARQVRQVALLSLLGLAAVMAGSHLAWPERYPPSLQVVTLLYTTLVVLLITRLANLVNSMNERLRSQRNELEQALAQVRQLAGHDELTQLPNRRSMVEELERLHGRRRRGTSVDCVALIDIDHFKRVNDVHGHATGDAVLRGFAGLGTQVLRAGDRLGRWGGEEFLLLMPDTDLAAAEAALQRLRGELQQTTFGGPGLRFGVTFSAGLSPLRDGEPPERCIERADHAMYRAKQAGRDRTVVDGALAAAAETA
jgi:diguanylate cyclase